MRSFQAGETQSPDIHLATNNPPFAVEIAAAAGRDCSRPLRASYSFVHTLEEHAGSLPDRVRLSRLSYLRLDLRFFQRTAARINMNASILTT